MELSGQADMLKVPLDSKHLVLANGVSESPKSPIPAVGKCFYYNSH